MTLPPSIRAMQQSWYFHLVIAALIVGGSVAFPCFDKSGEFSYECLKAGLVAAVTYLIGVLQHSPGSALFTKDGELNQPVIQVVRMQEAKIPVKVISGLS